MVRSWRSEDSSTHGPFVATWWWLVFLFFLLLVLVGLVGCGVDPPRPSATQKANSAPTPLLTESLGQNRTSESSQSIGFVWMPGELMG